MYELRQGTARLIAALYSRKLDAGAIRKIAEATNYIPEQLQEDIAALHDFFLQATAEAEADTGKES